MFFFILLIILIITFIIKCYQYYHRHSYINIEQFSQYYCHPYVSSINNNESCSLSTIDMFHKCENTNRYHIKSNTDYLSICQYIREFLCKNNEYMNKPGPVCPFIPGALKQQSSYFFLVNDQYSNKNRLIKMVQQCKNDFLYKLKPIIGNRDKLIYKCLIILIRSSNVSHSLIDEIQTELKPEFIIQHGLMFGEFHQSTNSTAIRNENVYPFRTIAPLLVIRYMVANDIIFLNQKHKYSIDIRMSMVKKYLNLYHSGLLYRAKTNHLEDANKILEELSSSITE